MPHKQRKITAHILVSFIWIFFAFLTCIHPPILADTGTSVTVPPTASNFQFSFSSLDSTSNFHQGATANYQITYGALQSAGVSSTITLTATYANDTINGTHVLDYVPGSASNAYNNTPPVIDLVNRTITWTFTLPQGVTNQTVSFQLQYNSNYTGSTAVPVSISAGMKNEYITFPNQLVNQTYTYSTVSQNSAITPTPTPSPTAIPTPVPQLSFSRINFRSISPTSITLSAVLSEDAQVTAQFGIQETNLAGALTTKTYARSHILVLNNLQENTTYYVRLIAQTAEGTQATSDIYMFHTGQFAQIPQPDMNSLLYIAQNVILYAGTSSIPLTPQKVTSATIQPPVIVLPTGMPYTIRLRISLPQTITHAEILIRNKNVLGITSTDPRDPSTQIAQLAITPDSYYQGRLESSLSPGLYDEFLRVFTTSGNIAEQKIADIHVSSPLRIEDARTHKPIEAAQVVLYYQDPIHHQFTLLPSGILPQKMPLFTSRTGELVIPLPAGVYQAHITALGYTQATVIFTLGAQIHESYPVIRLTPQPFNPLTIAEYYWTIVADTTGNTVSFLLGLAQSTRFFELNALIATALLVIVTFFALISRLKIPLLHLPSYLHHLLTRKQHANMIKGKLLDEKHMPIAGASVYLVSTATERILSHTLTSQDGTFICQHVPNTHFSLKIMADGFEQTVIAETSFDLSQSQEYTFILHERQSPLALGKRLLLIGDRTLAFCFEVLLILSLLAEVALGYTLGWGKASIFLAFSIANILLWIFHQVQVSQTFIKAKA